MDANELGALKAQVRAMTETEYLPDPPAECDMIMKGGITSGVVYPLAVCALAQRYRLRSLGGASAGAIAAAVAAAAEYRRQRDGSGDGFRRLADLPLELGERLESLFQPSPSTARPFRVFRAGSEPSRKGLAKGTAVAGAIIRAKPAWFGAGVVVSGAVALPGLIIAAGLRTGSVSTLRLLIGLVLPLALGGVLGLILGALGLALETMRALPANGFGLCDGFTATTSAVPLTAWLHATLNAIAGRDPGGEPLTVGDLWGTDAVEAWARGHQARFVNHPAEARLRSLRTVDLEVVTTNLTVRRPFRLPFETRSFLFSPADFSQLFPENVVSSLTAKPSPHRHPDTGEVLYYFPGPADPGPEHLPVVVVARMSLSFPGLISAVPLYAVDYEGDRTVRRMWFSDGGISSNFPMHFFDRLLPTRPTFGINLAPEHPVHREMVWRPEPTIGGVLPRARPLRGVPSFVASILDTMQNWADSTQVTQRGYADRVVEIRHGEDEGGINLRMPEHAILRLAVRGKQAGESLREFDWKTHRLLRYRIAMTRLSDVLDSFRSAWDADDGHLYREPVSSPPDEGPASSYYRGNLWRERDAAATAALVDVIAAWEDQGWPALATAWPEPSPELRMAPR